MKGERMKDADILDAIEGMRDRLNDFEAMLKKKRQDDIIANETAAIFMEREGHRHITADSDWYEEAEKLLAIFYKWLQLHGRVNQ
jgi:hypothetical protein